VVKETLLKYDKIMMSKVLGTISNIAKNLQEIESSLALEDSQWLLSKSKYYEEHFQGKHFCNYPHHMQRGDIVWVDFGINIGDEYSDVGRDGHYAMIWAQKGFVFIVLPLTSDGKFMNDFSVDIGKIPQLPLDGSSFVKIDMIRSVSMRRIHNINGVHDGKISITDETILKRIKDKLKEKFID